LDNGANIGAGAKNVRELAISGIAKIPATLINADRFAAEAERPAIAVAVSRRIMEIRRNRIGKQISIDSRP
jgi:hypothetical protein